MWSWMPCLRSHGPMHSGRWLALTTMCVWPVNGCRAWWPTSLSRGTTCPTCGTSTPVWSEQALADSGWVECSRGSYFGVIIINAVSFDVIGAMFWRHFYESFLFSVIITTVCVEAINIASVVYYFLRCFVILFSYHCLSLLSLPPELSCGSHCFLMFLISSCSWILTLSLPLSLFPLLPSIILSISLTFFFPLYLIVFLSPLLSPSSHLFPLFIISLISSFFFPHS